MKWFHWRFVLLALGLSVAHFALSAVLFGLIFSAGMERFDEGGTPAAWEAFAEFLLGTLHLPLVLVNRLTPIRVPAVIEMGLVCIDGLLWGFDVAWVIFRSKRVFSACV